MSVKFIYFDAGGVLFRFRSGLREMAVKHNLRYSDFELVFRKYDDQVVKGLVTPQQLWEYYQSELEFKEELDFLDYWVSKLTPIGETHQFVQELIDQHIPVGLITNLYSGVFEKAVDFAHIPNLPYKSVIQSSVVHMMKPDEEIYLLAQKESGQDPENILFTDDKTEFLEPAKSLGWKTVLFDEENPKGSIEEIKSYL